MRLLDSLLQLLISESLMLKANMTQNYLPNFSGLKTAEKRT
jgi:hypothetical protein